MATAIVIENFVQSVLKNQKAKERAKQRQIKADERQGLQNYLAATSLLEKALKKAQVTVKSTINDSPTLNRFLSRAKEYNCFISEDIIRYLLTLLENSDNRHGYRLILSRNPYKIILARSLSFFDSGRSWVVIKAQDWEDDECVRRFYTRESSKLAFLKQAIADINALTNKEVAKIILKGL